MTFDDYLVTLRKTTFAGYIDGHPDVVQLNSLLSRGLLLVPTEVQIMALSLYLGQVWATTFNDHILLDDGTVFLLDLEKRLAIFNAVATAGFTGAMEHLPAIFKQLYRDTKLGGH